MPDYKLEEIAPGQRKFQTERMRVPAILFSRQGPALDRELLERLERIASDPSVSDHLAVLSDAHLKPRIKNPTGGVVASESALLPELLDAAPNCGMRVILTDLREEELLPEKMADLFSALRASIPSKKFVGTKISAAEVQDIFRRGSRALLKRFALRTRNEFGNTYKGGDFFSSSERPSEGAVRASLPDTIFRIARYRLGLLGATSSHFLRLMKVSNLHNPELAAKLGIRQGQYLFFLHTGSSIVGRYALSLYTPRRIRSLSQRVIIAFLRLTSPSSLRRIFSSLKGAADLFPFRPATAEGQKLDTALRAVSNYGFANRTLITHQLDLALEKIFGRTIALELLYDSPHVYLDQEEHAGKMLWIHRNGANRAFGPARMTAHPIFKETGEPVLIAPFADGTGHIGVGTDENEASFSSANHEIGKAKGLGIAPTDYRSYSQAIAHELEANRIIRPVAEIETVKTLTY